MDPINYDKSKYTLVPLHETPDATARNEITLYDCRVVPFDDGRQIEVWKIQEHPGDLQIRIFKPLEDGSVAVTKFALSEEASKALFSCLASQLGISFKKG